MFPQIAVALLVLVVGAPDKKAAMVLECQGSVTLQTREGVRRPARAMDWLVANDRLSVGKDSTVSLLILADNHRERVKANSQVTITARGCTPATAVEKLEPATAVVIHEDVKHIISDSRSAAVVFRGLQPPKDLPTVTPMYGSLVLTERPTLSWKPLPGAVGYQVWMVLGRSGRSDGDKERLLWTVRTSEPRLRYPAKEKPLLHGNVYTWYVRARTDKGTEQLAWKSLFWVATKMELEELAALESLTGSKHTGDLLLAALTYEEYGVYEEAQALFQRLTKLAPGEPSFHAALAYYYERAGRAEEAKSELERARKLGPESRPR